MFYFLTEATTKPNRLETKNKDKAYHVQYGKFVASDASTSTHADFIAKTKINKNFYKGNQWIQDEDVEAFLKDQTGQTRNRIKVVHNLIRPMIEQYRGNAIRLTINASAKSVSKKAINRREESLGSKLLTTRVAEEFPALGRLLRDGDKSIGDTEKETRAIHENLYVDSYVKTINRLIQYVKNLNNLEEMQVMAAQNLGLSGLCVIEGFEHAGHQRYENLESEDFFFDRSAKRYDLSDADYMGKFVGMLPTNIFETFQDISDAERKAIESYVSDQQNKSNANNANLDDDSVIGGIGTTKVPVCHSYWRDEEKKTAGYVFDEYGYPYLIYIGETENPRTGEPYTEDDLIDPPESPKNKKLFKGKKKRSMYIDVLRFCKFIPYEAIGITKEKAEKEGVSDIVLDYGMHPYQETEWHDLSNVKFPFKCYTWGYVDGEIMSPVDDAINPQRFINRILSVAESQINNSGGTNVVIDKDSVDAQGGEDAIMRDVDQGKPITIRTKGRGVPNSLGVYDATPKQGTYALFNVIPIMEGIIQKDTGVNEGLKGESTGSDQLVGVTQLLIQRGSLMQEPFYNALSQAFLQVHQHTATAGKRMYIDNERELAIAVGDDGVEILELSKDMKNEDFRVFVTRENAEEMLFAQGDQMLNVFLQSGMIDEETYANLYSRSTPSEVAMALREAAGKKIELKRQQAKENEVLKQQEQQNALEQEAKNEKLIQEAKDERTIDKMEDHANDMEKIALKEGLSSTSKNFNN
jgi:hypothetical protein